MEETELLNRFSNILSDILGVELVPLTMDTVRDDIPDWDSFNYINFIIALEMEFDVSFGVADVESFKNVGDIVNALKVLIDG